MKSEFASFCTKENRLILVGKTAHYMGQYGLSPFLPHIFPELIIAVYFVAYNVE